jgi:sugar/nucleoside kinase (ribokinase family)
MLLFTPEGHFAAPAFPLDEVQDPTGAGDTFAGGFLGYLAAAGTLDLPTMKRAALAGTIMASFAVQDFGTQRVQVLNDEEYAIRVQSFKEMINIA